MDFSSFYELCAVIICLIVCVCVFVVCKGSLFFFPDECSLDTLQFHSHNT